MWPPAPEHKLCSGAVGYIPALRYILTFQPARHSFPPQHFCHTFTAQHGHLQMLDHCIPLHDVTLGIPVVNDVI